MSLFGTQIERPGSAALTDSTTCAPAVAALESIADNSPALQWDLRQNCSMQPRQLMVAYAVLCLLIATVGIGAIAMNLPVIGLYAALNVLVVTVACIHHVRHVRDGEIVTLVGRTLRVEAYRGGDVRRRAFDCAWLRVTHDGSPRSPVWLECGAAHWPIGLHVALDKRIQVRRQMMRAIASAR